MKKAYIAPATGVYNIGAANIIAASTGDTMSIYSSDDTKVDTSINGGVNQLGREDNAGSNIWDSEW